MSYAPHVGLEVVCIKEGVWGLAPGAYNTGVRDLFPLFGQVLTIRAVDEWNGGLFLRFVEIVNAAPPGENEGSFLSTHFRPVQKRPTDISVFTAILTGPKVLA